MDLVMSDYKELKEIIESNPIIQKEVERRKQMLPDFNINGFKATVDRSYPESYLKAKKGRLIGLSEGNIHCSDYQGSHKAEIDISVNGLCESKQRLEEHIKQLSTIIQFSKPFTNDNILTVKGRYLNY